MELFDTLFKLTGRRYRPFEYYGAPDAEDIVVLMGAATQTAEEVGYFVCEFIMLLGCGLFDQNEE